LKRKSPPTNPSSKLQSLRQRALKIAKTDFWTAFHMVHGNREAKISCGIVSVKTDEKD